MSATDSPRASELASPSRRRAMKAGAAIAVGAAVWTEPTIKGLARRPAYAASGSGAPVEFTFSFLLDGGDPPATITVSGVTLTVTRSGGNSNRYTFSTDSGSSLTSIGSISIGTGTTSLNAETNPFETAKIGGNAPATVSGTIRCD